MGLAQISVHKETPVDAPLSQETIGKIESALQKLAQEATHELQEQGCATEAMQAKKFTHLRYQGTNTSLVIALGDAATMQDRFVSEHRKQFGFAIDRKSVV